jgi:hypothetical protein
MMRRLGFSTGHSEKVRKSVVGLECGESFTFRWVSRIGFSHVSLRQFDQSGVARLI